MSASDTAARLENSDKNNRDATFSNRLLVKPTNKSEEESKKITFSRLVQRC